jgi:hypothetical protein
MMNDEFNAKIKLLVKSEKAMMRLEMNKKSRQTVLVAVALLAVLITLVMLNVTIFLYLDTLFTAPVSAAILTGGNFFFAVIFFVIASRQQLGKEAESIQEIRDFAWSQLSTDIDGVKAEVQAFAQSAQRVKSSVDSVVSGDFFGLKGVMPILQTLLEMRRKK